MIRDKYEIILRDFEMCHPHFYERTVDWWASGKMSIVVEMDNGTRYEFDRMDGTLRRLRDKDLELDEDILSKELCANLRKNIPLTGKTQADICEELGITKAALSRYINGNSSPSATRLFRIARVIGCTMDELFDETYIK